MYDLYLMLPKSYQNLPAQIQLRYKENLSAMKKKKELHIRKFVFRCSSHQPITGTDLG